MSFNVLVVDREPSTRNLCLGVLTTLGYEAEGAASGYRALDILATGRIDIVLADIETPGLTGFGLLKTIKKSFPNIDVVMMAGSEAIPVAVEAVQLGAYDYVTKPFKNEALRHLFQRLQEKQKLVAENHLLNEQLKAQQGFGNLIGTSAKMQKVYRLILKVAPKRHPVLIQGESGTGKELVARAIHTFGPWRGQPMVPIDCGGLSPTLIESELFGHVRGAFTGATQTRVGLLATAQGGTVFLDEIAELPVELQVKLLRALQEREFRPIGGNERVRLEARVIVATNQDLEAATRRGAFRRDLYFRLNVVSIKLPPLRERKSDISALVHTFVDRHGGVDTGVRDISYEAMSRLVCYDWPGNVRELENCIQRALSLSSGPEIQVIDLPSNLLYSAENTAGTPEVYSLQEVEKRAIVQALEATGGDRARAAKLLGIGKTTIYRKLKEYGRQNTSVASPSP